MPGFRGQTAMVTGGGTGIGLAIARGFASRGAGVIILGRRAGPLEEAAAGIRKVAEEAGCGGQVRAFPGVDVADEAAVTGMFDALESEGASLDVLVNNAGVSGPVTCLPNAAPGDFASAVAIHLTGTFWSSVQALRVMREGARIVTVSTFFTEERPLEQRPYRFRCPYTAAQGAKNRLAEAMAWELAGRGILSVATNPGPVHSDRIYKTVYPRAAAEFMRVGGFGTLSPAQVEEAASEIVPLLGEGGAAASEGIARAAGALSKEWGAEAGALERELAGLLERIGQVAEKIQKNTSRMIPSGQFLTQEQVAESVVMLAGGGMAAALNGRVVPGDGVSYAVRSAVGNAPPPAPAPDLAGKSVVITAHAETEADAERAEAIARHAEGLGAKAVCVLSESMPEGLRSRIGAAFHSHEADLSDREQVERWLNAAAANAGPVAAAVHTTGDVPAGPPLAEMRRAQWDALVGRFVTSTAAAAQAALEHFVPGGRADPRLFAGAGGAFVAVGPGLPEGRGAGGAARARAEIFRGALRPLAATASQELSDVLRSDARLFLALPGRADGGKADPAGAARALDFFLSPAAPRSADVVFCVDEARGPAA